MAFRNVVTRSITRLYGELGISTIEDTHVGGSTQSTLSGMYLAIASWPSISSLLFLFLPLAASIFEAFESVFFFGLQRIDTLKFTSTRE